MTCPETRIVAFLAGELSNEEERRFDRHLLSCEQCWRAVQADRAAHFALDQLREPAPAGLHDRVTLAVALAAAEASLGHRPSRRQLAGARLRATFARPRLRLVAAASLVVALAAGGALTWLTVAGRAAADPPQVAAVAAMVTPGSVPANALRAGEHLMVAHQPLVVRAYELEGGEVVVATSVQPFPVPATSHRLSRPSSRAWMAAKGGLSMYGVNRPGGQQSMFLVAAMPMAELPGIAARLHLI